MLEEKSGTKYVDAFLGLDEIALAEFRIRFLAKYTVAVIIAESTHTHTGEQKPLYFKKWIETKREEDSILFSRVSVIEIDLSRFAAGWEKEIASRDFLKNHIYINYPNHKFILSDLDEIPSHDQLNLMSNITGIRHFETRTYYRKANWQLRDHHKVWSKGIFGHTSIDTGPNGGRFVKWPVVRGQSPGAHFSYLSRNDDEVAKKLGRVLDHGDNLNSLNNLEIIRFSNRFHIDHLGRARNEGFGLLDVIASQELSDICLSLFEFEPKWFSFSLPDSSFLQRFLASVIVTVIAKRSSLDKHVYEVFVKNTGSCKSRFFAYSAIFLEILSVLARETKRGIRQLTADKFRKNANSRIPRITNA